MQYAPDFEGECYVCSTSPTVLVIGHKQPETNLCGIHFFNDPQAADWESWDDQETNDE